MSKPRPQRCPECRAGRPCPCPTPCPVLGEWIWRADPEPQRLTVQTARVGYDGPGALDITRKSGDRFGKVFAPSWNLLRPALEARTVALGYVRDGDTRKANSLLDEAWETYVPAYKEEMRKCYKYNRPQWDALLALDRIVLLCYCVDVTRCHRYILAGDILVKLGAIYIGEIGSDQKEMAFNA